MGWCGRQFRYVDTVLYVKDIIMSTQDNNYSFGSAASTAATLDAPSPPAGWYPDPENPAQQGYWDGKQWSRTQDNDTNLVPMIRKFSNWSLVLASVGLGSCALVSGLLSGTGPWPTSILVAVLFFVFSMGASAFALGSTAYSGLKKAPGAMRQGVALTGSILGGLLFGTAAYFFVFGGPEPGFRLGTGLALVVGLVVWLVADRKLKQASAN